MNMKTKLLSAGVTLVLGFAAAMPAVAKQPTACAGMTGVKLPDTTIELAQSLGAGANAAPVGTIAKPICRVVGVTASAVRFEVWLPREGWNGKFQLVANGVSAGVFS